MRKRRCAHRIAAPAVGLGVTLIAQAVVVAVVGALVWAFRSSAREAMRARREEGGGMTGAIIAMLRRNVAPACVGLALCLPAWADVRIVASPGGTVGPFLDLFAKVRASGERVVIDGPCLSACTLVLPMVPQNRICVTSRAVLGFHGARSVDAAGHTHAEPEASQRILAIYPPAVRRWIERHGGLTSRVLLLRGRELAAMYPRCQ